MPIKEDYDVKSLIGMVRGGELWEKCEEEKLIPPGAWSAGGKRDVVLRGVERQN